MKKGVLCILMACTAALAEAQYIPAFRKDTVEVKDPGKEYWSKGNTFKHLELVIGCLYFYALGQQWKRIELTFAGCTFENSLLNF